MDVETRGCHLVREYPGGGAVVEIAQFIELARGLTNSVAG